MNYSNCFPTGAFCAILFLNFSSSLPAALPFSRLASSVFVLLSSLSFYYHERTTTIRFLLLFRLISLLKLLVFLPSTSIHSFSYLLVASSRTIFGLVNNFLCYLLLYSNCVSSTLPKWLSRFISLLSCKLIFYWFHLINSLLTGSSLHSFPCLLLVLPHQFFVLLSTPSFYSHGIYLCTFLAVVLLCVCVVILRHYHFCLSYNKAVVLFNSFLPPFLLLAPRWSYLTISSFILFSWTNYLHRVSSNSTSCSSRFNYALPLFYPNLLIP